MPWHLDQAAPWLNPAGTGAPVNDEEDGYAKYLRTFAQPVESPVPDVAWAPPHYDFTDEEANPPHYDFTDDEANPPPSDLASIEIDPTNGKEPIDPYPAKIGKPRPMRDPIDPYAAPVNDGPVPIDPYSQLRDPYPPETPTPVPGGLVDRTLGRVAQKAGTANDLDRLGASETFVEKDAPDETPDQADASAADLYRRDPQARLRAELERDDLMRSEQIKLQTAANLRDAEEMKRNVERRDLARAKAQSDRAQIDADARALAQSPFKRYWSNASTGEKIGGALLAIAGGLMMPNTGGRNSGIDFMMKLADDDADQKWKAIQLRREQSGEAMADADEDFRTRETLRMAGREQVANQIRATLANFDPKGAHALAYGAGLAAIDAANAKAAAEADAENEKRAEANFKLADQARQTDIKEYEAISKDEQWRAEARRKAAAGVGGGKPTSLFSDKSAYTVDDWLTIDPRLKGVLLKADGSPKFDPTKKLTGKDVKDLLAITGDVGRQEADASRTGKVDQETALAEAGRKITDPFTGKDLGIVTNATDPGKLQEALTAGTTVLKTVDKLRRLAAKAEGASDWIKSDEWKEIKATQGFLTAQVSKALQLGAMDQGLQDVVVQIMGATDPTSFIHSAEAGLKMAHANFEERARDLLRGAGIDDSKWRVPDMAELPKAKKNELGARLAKRPSGENNLAAFGNEVANELGTDVNADEKLYDKAALDVAVTAIERDRDETAAADLAEAAGSSSNVAARKAAASRFWALRQSGNPTVVKAFNDLPVDRRAALVRQLPKEERAAYIREVAGLTEGDD